jgi:hypothetical protein
MGADAAWAIARFGEPWRFLAIKKMIRPRIKRAKIMRSTISQNGISPEPPAVPACTGRV